ncbi:MAG: O-acetyl-ADP-ribose deacetylase [Spirochaetales bacterium]|nr:O-acetyl-ADP-ribose deacetylase [Spirochaetales bacterium]
MEWVFGRCALKIVTGDITEIGTDAIVNAANNSLLGGGGVDGAIHRKAGPGLLEECRSLGGCPTGRAKITGAYNLPAKYVIHTVGPVYRGGQGGEAELLSSAYRSSLELAESRGLKSISFPAISAGVYGYPMDKASEIAIETITDHLVQGQCGLERVIIVLFSQSYIPIYKKTVEEIQRNKKKPV